MNKKISPKVSIIVPVYNVESYLHNCINSICNQTFNNFEVLLIDDGSTDKSGKICDQYAHKDKRFRVIHTDNNGLSSARNKGILLSRGDFITFIDSDDYVSNDLLEHMITIQNITNADIVSITHITTHTTRKKTINSKFNIIKYSKQEALLFYLHSLVAYKNDEASAWGKLYKKNIFNEIEFPIGKRYEDMVTVYQTILKSSIYVKSSKICYFYYMKPSSIIRSTFVKNDLDLLTEAERLYNLSKETNDKEIIHLAKIKKNRCYFTLLGKIAIFGVDTNISEKQIVNNLLTILRKNYLEQLFSKMPFSRKIILTLMCFNWSLAKSCIKLANKIRE